MNKEILFYSLSSVLVLSLSFIDKLDAFNPDPVDSYPNKLVLQSPDFYYLYWSHNNTDITFEIHYKNTLKWVLFGLSSPTSNYSDFVVGWVNFDGIGHFSDRKLITNNQEFQISVDKEQNWLVLDAFTKNDYKIIKFTRKIKFCDLTSLEDLNIEMGSNNKVIYSSGQVMNDNDGSFDLKSVYSIANLNILRQLDGEISCQPFNLLPVFNSTPTAYYSNQIDLVDGIFRFYWNFTSTDLIGEIHCKTNGWVGFGISPSGAMDNSDIFVGWIDDKNLVNFTSRRINKRDVLLNENQNWKLLFSLQSNGYTIFKFMRPLVICNSNNLNIEAGSPSLIYAYGNTDPPTGQDISYHFGNRGSKSVNLISLPMTKEINDEDDLEIIEFKISNVILPPLDMFYYCKAFQIPKNLTEKRHVLKYEIVLPTINRGSLHHLLIYECDENYDGVPAIWPSDSNLNKIKQENCKKITLGYPIGGNTEYKYIVPELHYNNPEKKIGYIEIFKIRYFVTKNLRKNELGVLTLGTAIAPFSLDLPPNVNKIGVKSYCTNDCISKYTKQANLTVIMAIPHTHLLGREVYTKIIRNGSDIGYLFRNKYYDFNYQSSYLLNPFVNVTKDDSLITYCGFQTTNRTKFIKAGYSAEDEMCYQFLIYYPREIKLKSCLSTTSSEEIGNLLQSLNDTGEIEIGPFNKKQKFDTFIAFYYDFLAKERANYSQNVANKFIELYNASRFVEGCDAIFDFDKPREPIVALNKYQKEGVCDAKSEKSLSNRSSSLNKINTLCFFLILFYVLNIFKLTRI